MVNPVGKNILLYPSGGEPIGNLQKSMVDHL